MRISVKGLLTALIACMATAAQAEPVTLKLATGAQDSTIWARQAQAYAQKVEELSDGQVKIEIFYAGQLGSMGDTLTSALSGRIDMWSGSLPILSGIVPEFDTLMFPFMFDSDEQTVCVVPKLTETARKAAGRKFHLLTFAPVEHQAMVGSVPLVSPDLLKGKKVRSAPSRSSINFFQSIGATPLPLPAEDTPSAASTHLVDAVNFGLSYAMASGLTETLPVYTRADVLFSLGAVIMSPRSWAKLDDQQKAALTDALSVMEFDAKLQEIDAFEKIMSEKLTQTGGTIVHLTPEQEQLWKDAAHATWDKSLSELSGDATGFFEAVQTAKADCGS
ncbi:TRAP transporter substrate-binding protein [Martelella soudanensis]|uniref:TRAP transporter substrate-binding protein n=1 Tax=unclassified Martelella TaxID=2629616 RepID=UPI0015DD7749|nr:MULTISPECIES: TRAP transporter substrate-binding protein [unclassified Martelella]